MSNYYNQSGSNRVSWPIAAMFMLGLGSQTKVYFLGCVALSELAVFVVAPFVLMANWYRMRKDGFISFVWWTLAIMLSLFISAMINHTPLPYVIKNYAMIYAVVSYFIVYYVLLRRNFSGVGWFFVGFAVSTVIVTFAFNPTAAVNASGFDRLTQLETKEIIGGPLYWIQRVKCFGQLPIMLAYLKTPLLYSLLAPLAFGAFTMMSTVSGRSATISVLLGAVFMIIGGKSRRKMNRIGHHFFTCLFVGLMVIIAYKSIYSYAASHNILSEDAQRKYDIQTDGGRGGVLKLLMNGRKEFFIGITAAIDSPIFGFGPTPPDSKGYMHNFISKYGTQEDIDNFIAFQYVRNQIGYVLPIVSHSHIIGAWLYYGIVGLLFYLWLLRMIYRHIRYYASSIPQWFGYFAITIPAYLWHIFFSPFGDRSTFPLLVCCLYFARAVGQGRMILPYEMEMEARSHE